MNESPVNIEFVPCGFCTKPVKPGDAVVTERNLEVSLPLYDLVKKQVAESGGKILELKWGPTKVRLRLYYGFDQYCSKGCTTSHCLASVVAAQN